MVNHEQFARRMSVMKRVGSLRHFHSAKIITDYHFELFTKEVFASPERYIWVSFGLPTEILFAMDLLPVDPDLISSWVAGTGLIGDLIQQVEQETGLVQVCSFHKGDMGVLHSGVLPVPRALVMSPMTCDSYVKMANYIQETFGSAFFLLDMPQEHSPESVAYVRSQFQEMVAFLSETTGARLKPERLREAIHLSNQTIIWWKKGLELAIDRSFPNGIEAMSLHMGLLTTLLGHPIGLKAVQSFYSERMANPPTTEKRSCYRLLWIHFAPYYKSFIDVFESVLGASVVVNNLLYPYFEPLDEADPFTGLAERVLTFPYLHLQRPSSFFIRLAQKFSVDGAVHFLPLNCRCNLGSAHLIKEALETHGIPVLQLYGDIVDARLYSDAQVRTRMEAFIELIAARKGAST